MQVRKQELELDMEQQTGSKQEKEYGKAVYCHPAYLTAMQRKTRDLFKKIRDTKGTFYAKMGSIKDRDASNRSRR